ncbi:MULTISPECIES: hypothetical protein [unclassified Streptococcus]|uniref:hypothetical protein n=1 Tax=unclassified Streptococcus TaxID=2608887 RepID=UPI000A456711|nr:MULTISPECIES: hypothetical protein [unclassified Streptococcus]
MKTRIFILVRLAIIILAIANNSFHFWTGWLAQALLITSFFIVLYEVADSYRRIKSYKEKRVGQTSINHHK